jgi:hypothetical protein
LTKALARLADLTSEVGADWYVEAAELEWGLEPVGAA